MRVSVRSVVFMMMVALVALGASGCFQEAGTGVVPTSPGGAAVIPPTTTPLASNTPLPSNTPVVQATPTVDDGGQSLIVSTSTPEIIVMVPTSTPPDEQEGVSAPALTATALIAGSIGAAAQATNTPFVMVQATEAIPLASTATPILINPQLQSGEMTATAIIVEATATAQAYETMTATASGILPPTATINPSAVPTATMTPDPASMCVHIVARGETAYSIAREYKVSLDDIIRANGLTNAALIHIGDELDIPGCGETQVLPEPTDEAETETGEGEDVCVQQEYVLQPGDNLYRLSLRFGVSLNALQNANNISNIHHIVAGRTLVIPCAD